MNEVILLAFMTGLLLGTIAVGLLIWLHSTTDENKWED